MVYSVLSTLEYDKKLCGTSAPYAILLTHAIETPPPLKFEQVIGRLVLRLSPIVESFS